MNITGFVTLAGNDTIAGGSTIEIGNGGDLDILKGGFLDLGSGTFIAGASQFGFENDGTLLQNGTSTVSVPFENDGAMRITAGSMTFTNGFSNFGTVEGRLTTNNDGSVTWTPNPTENDFSGAGVSDVLLVDSSGSMVDWAMSGSAIYGANHLTYQGQNVSLGAQWTVTGLGDLNGDGNADILLRNSSGTFYDWSMNGPTVTSRLS